MRLRDSSSDVCSTDLPGQKIPMLPDELIQAFALDAGQSRPALSLYVQADLESGEILSTETRLERIRVRENLRHNNLDDLVTEEALDNPRSEEHTSELQSLMRISYAVLCLKKKNKKTRP